MLKKTYECQLRMKSPEERHIKRNTILADSSLVLKGNIHEIHVLILLSHVNCETC